MAFSFPYIGNNIIPTDELIFFRGEGIPPTRLYIYITTSMMMGTLAISFSRRKSINIHGSNHNNNRDLINLIFGCDVIFDI